MKTTPVPLNEMIEDAEELRALGLLSDGDVEQIATRISASEYRQRVAAVHDMSGQEIKRMRNQYGLSQALLAYTLGMSVDSVSKWERGEIKPSGPALRILNTLAAKGPEAFIV
ncbi:helix-turn-helix domain-containing protein [Pantoea sp. EA-12]|uniref:helix-turn-helix domain-containing protein n=1 Tax=Pantoea sp. EA-12 TaxID=3043303 RepID=UPI0024B4C1AE|nr:helix-turn-helix domain-containing protein [Pantoea sp. EA-12]MDI9219443.1 helix-turn-helix domain-containing protein [Pantoea sp. EA-12]